jgi:CheY-like chemotaxis protein
MMPKLLLADDSITVQRVIALTFQGEGIEVIAVGDGDQAVAAIDRERPQIVLADLSMPGRDGYAVAEYVKRSPDLVRDTRVVLLTGAAEPVEEARSRALGIDGVLSKPFEPHVATALVRRLLSEPPTVPGFLTVVLEGVGAAVEAPAASVEAPSAKAAGGSMVQDTIAVDDYFRRLDEALATAGLATAPETAGDLAAIVGPAIIGTGGHQVADRSTDAETLIMSRADTGSAGGPGGSDDGSSKLVDAFSALLAEEEGDGATFVAGPLEMVGAPEPAPAVEWTVGHGGAAKAETATAAAPAPAAYDPIEAAPEPVAFEVVEPSAAAAPAMAAALEAVEAVQAAAEPVDAPTLHLPSPSPAALRADPPDQAAVDGIDLDVFADAVAQKILHRLTDARIDAIVSERVLEIAERLVREEIERIKADAQ